MQYHTVPMMPHSRRKLQFCHKRTVHLLNRVRALWAIQFEPDAEGPRLKPSEAHPGAGRNTRWEKARTKDGAGGGQADEQICARGRGIIAGMRLLKIEEAQTRMRVRDDRF